MTKLKLTLMQFLVLGVLGMTSLVYSQEQESKTMKIAENTYTFTTNGEYISMFVVTKIGVMVFETVNTSHANSMIKAIREVTDKPIKYAFHSHNHWDHSSGGKVFLDEGATTLAHIEAYEWMVANTGRDMAIPKQSWSGNRKDIEFGGTKVELHYLGMNHGMGMTIFILPQLKIAYIADLVTPNRVPFTIVPDFNIREWERTLEEVSQMDFDKAVFSHNESNSRLAGGTKQEVALQLQFVKDLRAGFYAELKKGTNPFLIPKVLKLPKYKDWLMYDQWLEMNIWRILSDEFLGPYPWRPERSE